jgi:hypothetical protein
VIDRFIEDERLLEIRKLRPGERCDHELSYGTVISYLSVLKHFRAKWRPTRLNRVKPIAVQEWLKSLEAAPKTKGHIKALIASFVRKGDVVGDGRFAAEPHAAGRNQGHQQAAEKAADLDGRAVLPVARSVTAAVSHDDCCRAMLRTAG